MHLSHLHYLPLSPPFFSILVGIFLVLLVLVEVEALFNRFIESREIEARQ
jgi:hypothetical protein